MPPQVRTRELPDANTLSWNTAWLHFQPQMILGIKQRSMDKIGKPKEQNTPTKQAKMCAVILAYKHET